MLWKKAEDATLVRVTQRFLEEQKELVADSKPVTIKKATLSLPTRQEGSVAERWGQVSQSVVDLEDEEGEAQMMPIARAKWCCLETEVRVAAEVGVEGLVLGKVGEGGGNGNNDNNNDNNDNREETPLAERVAVAKAIARSLGDKREEEAEAGPEVGPSGNR